MSNPEPSAKAIKAKAMASIALLPIALGFIAQPAFADIVNTASVTGTPESGILAATNATESVGVAVPLVATDDSAVSGRGASGNPAVVNLFENDSLDGGQANSNNTFLALAPGSEMPPELSFDPTTGLVGLNAGTPAGVYTFSYQLCETANPENCRIANVAVTVEAPAVVANEDEVSGIVGSVGEPNAINAFENDLLDGEPINLDEVTASVTTPANPLVPNAPVPTLDAATGNVAIPAGTPAGTYTIEYQICEDLNPSNCASSSITIVVVPAEILAVEDNGEPVRSGIGNEALINVFANDTLNGDPATPGEIIASVITPATHPGVALDPVTGNVSVATDVPAGTYIIEYQICEVLNPTNCATSSVTIVVEPPISDLTGKITEHSPIELS